MIRSDLRVIVTLLVAAAAAACGRPAESQDATAMPSADDRIALAMQAAPPSISAQARIVDFDANGELVELRPGTNGWMCLPNDPNTPGEDPMCLDGLWQEWVDAWINKRTPAVRGVGIAYMLRGGTSASNTDPFAQQPAPGGDWMHDPPHIMVIVPDPRTLDSFPDEHSVGRPWVMFKGTPYAHLMVPTTDGH
jgi:hypothetical protein